MSFCTKCGTQLEDDNVQFCTNCGAKVGETAVAEPAVQLPMKWYKFLIYFALFLGAVVNLISGVNFLTGNIYVVQSAGEASAELVYTYFSGLQTVDMVYGIGMIAIAAYGIYTRFMLAKFKAVAPKCVVILYIVGAVWGLIYNLAAGAITGVGGFDSSMIVSLVTAVAMALLK